VGEALRHRPLDTDPGPPRRFGAFDGTRHAREAAETLWTFARKIQRSPLGPGETLPGCQEGLLNPHEDGKRGSFAMDIKLVAKLLVVKTQA
jgi:hypothetical protein